MPKVPAGETKRLAWALGAGHAGWPEHQPAGQRYCAHPGRLVIAIDVKAVRGARNRDRKAPLVVTLAHGVGAVLGQVAVDEEGNEIPAVRELLKAFAGLAGRSPRSARYIRGVTPRRSSSAGAPGTR